MHTFDKLLSFMLKPWVIAFFTLLAIVSFAYIDKPLALYMYSFKLRQNLPILNFITNFGSSKIYLLGLPILAIICSFISSKKVLGLRAWMLWIFVLYPSLIAMALKTLLGRARPVILFDSQSFGFFGWHFEGSFHSFPSGHTTTITGLMIGLLILFPRYCYLFLVIGLLVLASRVFLTYHYLSDVLVSFYLVILELGVFLYFIKRKYPKICELILNEKVS